MLSANSNSMHCQRRTVLSSSHTVDTQSRVLLGHLSTLDIGQGIDRAQTRVLGKGERDSVQSLSERSHGVLLNGRDLVGLLGDGDRGADLGGSTSVNHSVVLDQISHDTDGIVQRPLSLVDDLRR